MSYSINSLANELGPVSLAAQEQRRQIKGFDRSAIVFAIAIILTAAAVTSAYCFNSQIPAKTVIYAVGGSVLGASLITSGLALVYFKRRKDELERTLTDKELRKYIAQEEKRNNQVTNSFATLQKCEHDVPYTTLDKAVKEMSIEDLSLPNAARISNISLSILKMYCSHGGWLLLFLAAAGSAVLIGTHTNCPFAAVASGFSILVLPLYLRALYLSSQGLLGTAHKIKREFSFFLLPLVLGIIGYVAVRGHLPETQALAFFIPYSGLALTIWLSSTIYAAARKIKESHEDRLQEQWLYADQERKITQNELSTILNELKISDYLKGINEIKGKLAPVREDILMAGA